MIKIYFVLNQRVIILCVSLLAGCNAYVNLALNKPAFQSNPYEAPNDIVDAAITVDGLKSSSGGGQCTSSADDKQTTTWWVDLTTIHSIHHIRIYFKTSNEDGRHVSRNFKGFSVYVSNTTDRQQGKLCANDTGDFVKTSRSIFTIKCPMHGQYVIYHNEKLAGIQNPGTYNAYSVESLCEVEVYGCQTHGYYGSDCSTSCPDVNCQHCHIETGTCLGCKPGYKGQRCESDCEEGWYGVNCKETCGHCRDMDQCSNTNGTCLTGCEAGFQGKMCNTTCDRGWYSVDCNETCAHCRDLDHCSPINGTCFIGCSAGFHGDFCNATCDFGYYGLGCRQKCSTFCKTPFDCHPETGQCNGGCIDGWEEQRCLKVSISQNRVGRWKMMFYGMFCIVASFLIIIGIMVSYCVLTRLSKKEVLINHDYNDKPETGSAGFSIVPDKVVSFYYYREQEESNGIDMTITNPTYNNYEE